MPSFFFFLVLFSRGQDFDGGDAVDDVQDVEGVGVQGLGGVGVQWDHFDCILCSGF